MFLNYKIPLTVEKYSCIFSLETRTISKPQQRVMAAQEWAT